MVFIPEPDPNPLDDAARRLNAELMEVVGGVIAELGGPEGEGGPVHAIVFEEVQPPVIMDWYIAARDGRPLARVLAYQGLSRDPIANVVPITAARKVRIRVERYTQGEGKDDGTPSC